MKRITAMFCALACFALLLPGCSSSDPTPTAAPSTVPNSEKTLEEKISLYQRRPLPETKISEDITLIASEPGVIIPAGTSFELYNRMEDETDRKGTIERVDYTTDAYEDGITYEKYCNVYLPYGYDPEDTDTKYNVLYFQHGNKLDPEEFAIERNKNLLDNLFAAEGIEPLILVFPTYYMDVEGDADLRKLEGQAPAGDGNWKDLPGNYYLEIIEDVIPAVESRYNTYTETFDSDGLIASREHRGFSGYSRGSVCTWYMLHSALPYFKWYSPMSANCTAGKTIADNPTHEDAYLYLKEAVDKNPEMDFFIYSASGGPGDAMALREEIAYFIEKTDLFSYGADPTNNNLFYTVSNYPHSDIYAPYYYYNSLRVLFH